MVLVACSICSDSVLFLEGMGDVSASRILLVTNLSSGTSAEKVHSLFHYYGHISQTRLGNRVPTSGRCFVIFEHTQDAREARAALDGYKLDGRYISVRAIRPSDVFRSAPEATEQKAAQRFRKRLGL